MKRSVLERAGHGGDCYLAEYEKPGRCAGCFERRIKALGPQQSKGVASSQEVCPEDPQLQALPQGRRIFSVPEF